MFRAAVYPMAISPDCSMMVFLRPSLTHLVFLCRFSSLDLQVFSITSVTWQGLGHCLSSASQHSWRCCRASSSQLTRVYVHAQDIFLQFCQYYDLLLVPADQETLLCFATFLADAKGLQHRTVLGTCMGWGHCTFSWVIQTLWKVLSCCTRDSRPSTSNLTQHVTSWP